MAALLNTLDLCRHALPVHCATSLDRAISRRFTPIGAADPAERLRPIATWRIGTAGRPVCAWQLASPAPDFPSG